MATVDLTAAAERSKGILEKRLNAKDKGAVKQQLADAANVDKKDVSDKNLVAVNEMKRGAELAQKTGQDPTALSVDQLRGLGGGDSSKDTELDKSNQKRLAQALLVGATTIIGSALGGAAGGAAGAGAAGRSIREDEAREEKEGLIAQARAEKDLERQSAIAQRTIDQQREQSKEERLAREKDREFGLKERELAIKGKEVGNKQVEATMAAVDALRKERNSLPITKDTQTSSVATQKIREAAANPSAASDLSLIFSYMKVLDPGSTVREGEFANAQNATGVPDKIRNLYEKVRTGERLNDTQRMDFLSQAERLHGSQIAKQKKVDTGYASLAKKRGLDSQDILTNFGEDEGSAAWVAQQQGGAPASVPAKVMGGIPEANAAPAIDPTKMSRAEKLKYLQGR